MDQMLSAGTMLHGALRKSKSRARRSAILLVAPLLLFVAVTFALPIFQLLVQSVHNPAFSEAAPKLSQWFAEDTKTSEPTEAAFAALVEDLRLMKSLQSAGQAGTRVNYDYSGARSLFAAASRQSADLRPPFKDALVRIDKRWADPELWKAMRNSSSPLTFDFYLSSVDLTRDATGDINPVPEQRRIYIPIFFRTLLVSAAITLFCFIAGYPVAFYLAHLPLAKSNLLMVLVLLPFWTSLLVRTTSWIILLQKNGIINDVLVTAGIISDADRFQMAYNQAGTIVAMCHILLPFMILPLYSVMKSIPLSYVRAARSLGASSWVAFRRVYFPQTLPGVAAGSLLVFILAIGYYITPALIGGASGQLISNLIAYHMQSSLNWSLAAALSTLLLITILLLYWLYDRLVGIDNVKLG